MKRFLLITVALLAIASPNYSPAASITDLEGITGKIGQEDIYWDNGPGAAGTFTVPTYDGGTVSLTKVPRIPFKYEIDALDYGNKTFTQASLEAAATAVGSAVATILVRPGQWVISSNMNLTAIAPNATFKMAPGAYYSHGAYTINIPNLSAGPEQIVFVGTGTITLSGYVKEAYPRWFNVAGDGSDETANITRWLLCGVKRLFAPIPAVSYAHKGITIPASTSSIYIEGATAPDSVLFDYISATGNGLTFTGEADAFHMKNIKWNSSLSSTGAGVYSNQLSTAPWRDVVLEDVTVSGFKSGILTGGGLGIRIIRGRVSGQGSAVSGGVGIRAGNDVTHATNDFVIDSTYVSSFETNIYNSYAAPLKIANPICEAYITGIRGDSGTLTILDNPYFYSAEAGGLRDIWLADGGYMIHTGVRGKSLGFDIDGAGPRYHSITPRKLPIRAYLASSDQVIATGSTPTTVTLTESLDPDGQFAANTFTAIEPGYIKVMAMVQWDLRNTGTYKTHIYKNSSAVASSINRMVGMDTNTFYWTQTVQDEVWLDAGDTITLRVEHDAGSSESIKAGTTNTYLIVTGL